MGYKVEFTMKNLLILFVLILLFARINAQFAPSAGETGSTAIYKDDLSFVGWAKTCKVTRGFINISDTTITFTQDKITSSRAFFGSESMVTGKAGGALDCISLGDGGTAILTFDFPIRNGEGYDFAVFENGIKMPEPPYQYFLELAFVEVSTDGKKYVRFPAISNTQVQQQIESFGQISPEQINNLAGKYIANYGTPFDLDELRDSVGINTDSINFVRLIDVGGIIDSKYASYDSKGNIINDPFPTEFWSGGFDLDAVGVIHLNGITGITKQSESSAFKLYPNPVKAGGYIYIEGIEKTKIELWSQTGKKIGEWQPDNSAFKIPDISSGCYFLSFRTDNEFKTIKLMVE